MKITFQKNGVTKQVKVGFSWTTLFFGWFAAVARGMWPQALIGFFTFNFSSFYYMFTINRIQAQNLILDGWTIHEADRAIAEKKWGIR